MAMTSRDRVLAALRRQEPDRVPVVEFVVDPKVAAAAAPGSRDVADALDRLDLDAVSCGARFAPVETRPDGSWVDEWGVTYLPGAEVVAHPIAGPIRSAADLRRYTPPDPAAPHRLGELPELVQRYQGRRAIIFHQRTAFMWAAYLVGIDVLLESLLTDPGFAGMLLDMVLEVNLALARRAARAGADVIVLGDDYAHNAGPMMSPAAFREFLLPRLRTMVQTIHEEGALVIKHSDGNLYPILEDIVASGADGLNPIEPAAGMDLATTKRLIGKRMALVGNVDCAHLLPNGTPEQVRQTVRQCLRDAAAGGGYLLSSSNSIHSGVKAENFIAMVQAAKEYGEYPIRC